LKKSKAYIKFAQFVISEIKPFFLEIFVHLVYKLK